MAEKITIESSALQATTNRGERIGILPALEEVSKLPTLPIKGRVRIVKMRRAIGEHLDALEEVRQERISAFVVLDEGGKPEITRQGDRTVFRFRGLDEEDDGSEEWKERNAAEVTRNTGAYNDMYQELMETEFETELTLDLKLLGMTSMNSNKSSITADMLFRLGELLFLDGEKG